MPDRTGLDALQVRGVIPRNHLAIQNQPDILPRVAFKRLLELSEDVVKTRRRVAMFLTEDHPLAVSVQDMSVQELLIFLIGYTRQRPSQVLSAPEMILQSKLEAQKHSTTSIVPPASGSLVTVPLALDLDDEDLALFTEVPIMSS